jgi:hypothetical protein
VRSEKLKSPSGTYRACAGPESQHIAGQEIVGLNQEGATCWHRRFLVARVLCLEIPIRGMCSGVRLRIVEALYCFASAAAAKWLFRQVVDPIGGPGRTRTCNQTVMSGRIMIDFVECAAFSSRFERVRCDLIRPFLVRSWCGAPGRLVAKVSVLVTSASGLKRTIAGSSMRVLGPMAALKRLFRKQYAALRMPWWSPALAGLYRAP